MSRLGRTGRPRRCRRGCWPDAATLNPGVAVQAGDETVSVREVDDLTADYCDALSPSLEVRPDGSADGGSAVPAP